MADVFISYKREDEDRARFPYDALKSLGIGVFWDHDIVGGERWDERLESELESPRCVVVLWSKGSTGPSGDFVRNEARRAQQRGVLLPVRIDEVAYPLGFGGIQTVDLIGWAGDLNSPYSRAFAQALSIKIKIEINIPGGASRTPSRRRNTRFPRRRGVLPVLAAIGLIACGVFAYRSFPTLPKRSQAVSRYERRTNATRVLVFVHGIFGDADETWKCPSTGVSWPKLIADDIAFNGLDLYTVAYASPFWGNTMTIDEIVSNLSSRFEADGVFLHREVLFVAHSMGGLVVQRYLLTHRENAGQVPLIFFYSTPETGAQIAELARLFSADPLLKQMLPGDYDGYLLNLENEWLAAHFPIQRLCAYEKKPTKGVLVVDRLSGSRNCTNQTPLPINEDHAGIVKPCSRDADAYIALRSAVQANLKAGGEREKQEGSSPPNLVLRPVVEDLGVSAHNNVMIFRFRNEGNVSGWVGDANMDVTGDGVSESFKLEFDENSGGDIIPIGGNVVEFRFSLNTADFDRRVAAKHCTALKHGLQHGDLMATYSLKYSSTDGNPKIWKKPVKDFYNGIWPRACYTP